MKFTLVGIFLLCVGIAAGWIKICGIFHPGNNKRYNISHVPTNPSSPLCGKTIFCLGSSVTSGSGFTGISFVEYIGKIDGCRMIKESGSASLVADRGRNSYLRRLLHHPATQQAIDCFLCQLSSNDATFGASLGSVCDSFDRADFDTKTTVGALEYIISYAREIWNCPVVFLTITKYDNARYHFLVNQVLELQEKWEIEVIDLWHDPVMNAISPTEYQLYMNDIIHPTKAGYLEWWTPRIQAHLYRILQDRRSD